MDLLDLESVEELHRFALANPERYYRTLIKHLGLTFSCPFDQLCDDSRGAPFPSWFPGGKLNIVDTCLRSDGEGGNGPAIVTVFESGQATASVSRSDFRQLTAQLASRLVATGIAPGDCVGLFLPMTIEAAVAFFACAWVGAIAVPCFSGYGPESLATRLKDCKAKLLVVASGFHRKGKWIEMADTARAALSMVACPPDVICVADPERAGTLPSNWRDWEVEIAAGALADPVDPVQTDPNHPLLLMYTSGTTGQPKGIVHSHAGFLLKCTADFALAFNVKAADRFAWATDLGWIVGPQMIVANAALGATSIFFVGALDSPDQEQMWRFCEQQEVTILGISPSAVRAMGAAEPTGPTERHDLSRLHSFISTGEAWDERSWRWLFEKVGMKRRPIVNYSGGTEIGGGILAAYAVLPMRECAFSGPVIGMGAEIIYNDTAAGAEPIGELVVTQPWPGMTHGFWGNDDARYLETYWSTFPGVWHHGDLATRDSSGWWYIRGRSDDTIKTSGRRVGPAEIENVLLLHSSVVEAAVVGAPDALKGQKIIAFIIAADGAEQSSGALSALVRARLGASMVPSEIYFIGSLPKTRNGKIVRRALAAAYAGEDAGDVSALANFDVIREVARARLR
ncbi:AMP-binding protein [Sphingopyxis macrogoltabida]|nr:AMP-binding protein [Sphingopyxis macrogoltabida]